MKKATRLLKEIDVHFISLVGKGANGKTIIYKSDNNPENPTFQKEIKIAKVDSDERLVMGIVYSPDQVDSQGDTATAETIKKSAYNFMKNLRLNKVDKSHDSNPDEGCVVESWIVRKGDELFPNEVGAWAVTIKVDNDETWQAVKDGEITGLSLAGLALADTIEPEPSEPVGKSFIEKIKSLLGIEKSDFTEANQKDAIMRMVWVFEDVIRNIYTDKDIADKKAAVLTSLEQLKGAVEVQKEGKAISAKNLAKIKASIAELSSLLEGIENINKQNPEDKMTQEEVKKAVDEAVDKAVKPVAEALEKSNQQVADLEKVNKELVERLEKVEKASPGSSQTIETKKEEARKDSIWW